MRNYKRKTCHELEIPDEVKLKVTKLSKNIRTANVLLIMMMLRSGGVTGVNVCANEEVLHDGSHEKCGSKEVERRSLKQWMLKIPLYAERC